MRTCRLFSLLALLAAGCGGGGRVAQARRARRPRTRRPTWRARRGDGGGRGGRPAPAAARRGRGGSVVPRARRSAPRARHRRLQERLLLRRRLLPLRLRRAVPVVQPAGQRRHVHERSGRHRPAQRMSRRRRRRLHARRLLRRHRRVRGVRARHDLQGAGLRGVDGDVRGAVRRRRRVRRRHQQLVRAVSVRQRRQCRSTCTTAADCVAGAACVNGSCGPKPPGAPCTAGSECASTFCAQGVCCTTACAGTCKSCAILAAAKASASTRRAAPIRFSQCTDEGAMTCGSDGTCDGAGACRHYSGATTCAPGDLQRIDGDAGAHLQRRAAPA